MAHAEEHHDHHRADSCDEQAMAKHSITDRDNCPARAAGGDHFSYTQAAARIIPRHDAWNLKLSGREIRPVHRQLGGGFGSEGWGPGIGAGRGGSGLGMGRGSLGGIPCGLGWLMAGTSSTMKIGGNQASNKAFVMGESRSAKPSMTL
jgi:hypothetical protein